MLAGGTINGVGGGTIGVKRDIVIFADGFAALPTIVKYTILFEGTYEKFIPVESGLTCTPPLASYLDVPLFKKTLTFVYELTYMLRRDTLV